MARKRKRNEQVGASLEELPRRTEELTDEEAEAAQGGYIGVYSAMYGAMVGSATSTSSGVDSVDDWAYTRKAPLTGQ